MSQVQNQGTAGAATLPAGTIPRARASTVPVVRLHLGKAVLVGGVLLIVALLAGALPRWKARQALRAENAELGASYVSVVHPITSTNQPALLLPGEVRPLVEASIHARTSGYLKRWLVDLGAEVKQGQLLAEIDTPEINQQLAQAKAELAQAEAGLALAKTTDARWQDLLKTASVSEQEAAEKTAELATRSATVEAARANVRRLQELQSFQRVVAPFDGVITARRTDTGDLINAGMGRELFHLAQTKTLRVFVRVPQVAAQNVSAGQTVELVVAERAGARYPAKVVRTASVIDPESRTMLTELEVNNDKGEILAGSFTQANFTSQAFNSTLVVPSTAILFRSVGAEVGVVGAENRVELRPVKLGRDFGPTIEVLSGVTTADRVITTPSDSLESGMEVRLATETKDKPAK